MLQLAALPDTAHLYAHQLRQDLFKIRVSHGGAGHVQEHVLLLQSVGIHRRQPFKPRPLRKGDTARGVHARGRAGGELHAGKGNQATRQAR